MATIEINETVFFTKSSTPVDVQFEVVPKVIPWVGNQKLDRSLGTPRALGEGARRAVQVHGEILERLAE